MARRHLFERPAEERLFWLAAAELKVKLEVELKVEPLRSFVRHSVSLIRDEFAKSGSQLLIDLSQ